MLKNRPFLPTAVAIVFLLAFGLVGGGAATEQQDGFPPWPIVLKGNVSLDGQSVGSGELSVRIGDWESKQVPVVKGTFRCSDQCLIAGPPSGSYIGELVSFVLDNKWETDLGFTFPENPSPEIMEVSLSFDSSRVAGTPVPTKGYADREDGSSWLWIAVALALFALAPLVLIVYRRVKGK